MESTERMDHTNYEQEHPRHLPEEEYWARAQERLDRALRNIEEAERRMARNVGHGLEGHR
jgi:hypothetical protein